MRSDFFGKGQSLVSKDVKIILDLVINTVFRDDIKTIKNEIKDLRKIFVHLKKVILKVPDRQTGRDFTEMMRLAETLWQNIMIDMKALEQGAKSFNPNSEAFVQIEYFITFKCTIAMTEADSPLALKESCMDLLYIYISLDKYQAILNVKQRDLFNPDTKSFSVMLAFQEKREALINELFEDNFLLSCVLLAKELAISSIWDDQKRNLLKSYLNITANEGFKMVNSKDCIRKA